MLPWERNSISVVQLPKFAQLFSDTSEKAFVKILVQNPKDVDVAVSIKVIPRLSNASASLCDEAYFPSDQLHLLSKYEPYTVSKIIELAAPTITQCQFTLKAYEDDLLKDNVEHKSIDSKTDSSVGESSQSLHASTSDITGTTIPEWTVSIDHNVAIVSIPVIRPTGSILISESAALNETMCDINLQLRCVKVVSQQDQSDPVDLFVKITFMCS